MRLKKSNHRTCRSPSAWRCEVRDCRDCAACSSDDTLTMIQREAKKNSSIAYVNLLCNFGKEAGMLAGFDYAKGDAVVIIDADLQDPPELIPQMIELWEQGYDDVYARRCSRQGETWLKKKTSEWYYRI